MTMPSDANRDSVAEVWQAVLDGVITRSDANRWARQWVESDDPGISDPMVWAALQRLHGFDLVWTNDAQTTVRHGGSADYVHTAADIRNALATWRSDCASYDADPEGYIRRKREAARSAAQE